MKKTTISKVTIEMTEEERRVLEMALEIMFERELCPQELEGDGDYDKEFDALNKFYQML